MRVFNQHVHVNKMASTFKEFLRRPQPEIGINIFHYVFFIIVNIFLLETAIFQGRLL